MAGGAAAEILTGPGDFSNPSNQGEGGVGTLRPPARLRLHRALALLPGDKGPSFAGPIAAL
jgi:hypothetical protein